MCFLGYFEPGDEWAWPPSYGDEANIMIDGDQQLLLAKQLHGWSGSGAFGDPILVTDIELEAGPSGSGLKLSNTTLHLVIQNISVRGSGGSCHGLMFDNSSNITVRSVGIGSAFIGI
ncbi:MAG TPA: hypothetical protein VLH13_02275, partial [Methanomassiliicoccales archaeon]|nr:hypothetical protein [Methanomassiliicoccales archaeon]